MAKTPARVLVIEDQEMSRRILIGILKTFPAYEVTIYEADNGKEGLNMFFELRNELDLVITDLRMPGLDGLEVLARIAHTTKDVPVIIYSGAEEISDAIQALRLGAFDYISKQSIDRIIVTSAVVRAFEYVNLRRERRKLKSTIRERTSELERINAELKREIDDRQRAEDELRRMQGDLEVRIRLRTKELEKAKEKAEAASKAKSEFLASISHELRTPMNIIIGFTEELLEQNLSNIQHSKLHKVYDYSKSLLKLLNDLLDFAKAEAGKLELVSEMFDPVRLVNSICNEYRELARERGLHFSAVISPQVPERLIGDAYRLRQILTNLLDNALKFTPEGLIEISLSINVTTNEKVWLLASVSDTGLGIAPHKIKDIFSEFVQADSSKSKQFGGSGLGLGICRKLTELMEGRIWVESTEGMGSTFYFTAGFRIPDEMRRKAVDGNRGTPEIPPLNILAAEDNRENAELLVLRLTKRGHRVAVAENGRIALEMLDKTGEFDLVLMDLHMPVMDGLEACRIIRSQVHKPYSDIPIIALTADVFAGAEGLYMEAGMDGYVSKPINMNVLLQTIAEVFKKKGQEWKLKVSN